MASVLLLRPSSLLKPQSSPSLTLKPHTTPFPSLALPLPKPRRQNGAVSTRMLSSSSTTPQPTERLISIASYSLPFLNSIQYGRFLLSQHPSLALLFDPFIPFLSLYRSLPYASFIAFFALYLGLARNPNLSRFVRFNAMQAVTLDVLLVVPLLLQRILSPGRAGLGFRVMVWAHNFIFVFSVACFLYSVVCCVVGRTPTLPFVADAASRQV